MEYLKTFKGFLNESFSTNFDKDIQKLIDLQIKIAKSADFARSRNRLEAWWENSATSNYERKWEALMTKLRGWATRSYDGRETNPEWIEYCEKNGLSYDYDFGDVIA